MFLFFLDVGLYQMSRNSTIRTKFGICPLCGDHKEKPLTKGMCSNHYWQSIRIKSVAKQEERELAKDESLSTLVADLDIVFSRYIRLKHADLYGKCTCISCGKKEKWVMMDNGHFIPRQHMHTRFSEDNCFPQCKNCNQYLNGNLIEYAKSLEDRKPGSVAALQEQANVIYKYDRTELKAMISEYTNKTKQLK